MRTRTYVTFIKPIRFIFSLINKAKKCQVKVLCHDAGTQDEMDICETAMPPRIGTRPNKTSSWLGKALCPPTGAESQGKAAPQQQRSVQNRGCDWRPQARRDLASGASREVLTYPNQIKPRITSRQSWSGGQSGRDLRPLQRIDHCNSKIDSSAPAASVLGAGERSGQAK